MVKCTIIPTLICMWYKNTTYLLDIKPGTQTSFVSAFYLFVFVLLSVLSRIKNTGCVKTPYNVFTNRQGVALPVYVYVYVYVYGLANNPLGYEHKNTKECKPVPGDKRSADARHGLALGGSSKGASPFMFISPLGEKKSLTI